MSDDRRPDDRLSEAERLLSEARDYLQHHIGSSYSETGKDDEQLVASINDFLNEGVVYVGISNGGGGSNDEPHDCGKTVGHCDCFDEEQQ